MPKALRSVLAVLAGYVSMGAAILGVTLLYTWLLQTQPGHPTNAYLLLSLVFSFVSAMLGGWVASKLAGYRSLEHGVALGVLILALGIVFLVHPAEGQPLWHQWALTLLSPLFAITGAWIARRGYAGRKPLLRRRPDRSDCGI